MQEFKSRLAKSLEYVLQDIFLLSSLKLYSICIHAMYYFAYVQYAGFAQHQMIHFLTLQAFAKRWHTRNIAILWQLSSKNPNPKEPYLCFYIRVAHFPVFLNNFLNLFF